MSDQRRLDIARQLVQRAFSDNNDTDQEDQSERISWHQRRYMNTLQMIADPENSSLYTMELERLYLTNTKLLTTIKTLKDLASHKSNLRILANTLRNLLKSALFGCEVYIGLCSDASVSIIEFTGEKDYIRKVNRGQSICFECLDQRDIVLQASSIADSNASKAVVDRFSSGESTVYVPLLGRGAGIGVIEIHGLLTEGITHTQNFERNIEALKSMIRVRDYRFVKSLRLWRHPSKRTGGSIDPNDTKDYNRASYHVVCGRVSDIVYEENGIPFFNGVRYNVTWEDGLVERILTAHELLEVAKNTPQSLGGTSALDVKLVDDLLQLGLVCGELFENQRREDTLHDLKKHLFAPGLADDVITSTTMAAVLGLVFGGREVSLVGDLLDSKLRTIASASPPLRPRGKSGTTDMKKVCKQTKAIGKFHIANVIPDLETEWICIQLEMVKGFRYLTTDLFSDVFLVVTRVKRTDPVSAGLDVCSLEEISTVIAKCLCESWKKVVRKRERNALLKELETRSSQWTDMTDAQFGDACIEGILPGIPGAHLYVGILQHDENGLPNVIHYVAASRSTGSAMLDKQLLRGEGLSFDVVEMIKTIIIHQNDIEKTKLLDVGSLVDVLYGRTKTYRAKILRYRGHESYDIQYDTGEKEAGVKLDRINPVHTAFQLKAFGEFKCPFVCAPIRHRDKGLGVIAVDTFSSVEKAFYEQHPESGVITMLENSGRLLGTLMDQQKKRQALQLLVSAIRNFNIRREDLAEEAMLAVKVNLLYLSSFTATRVYYEKAESPKKGVDIFFSFGKLTTEHRSWLMSFDVVRSSRKPIQMKGDKVVWMLFRNQPVVRGGEGKIFVFMLTLSEPLTQVDREFLEVLYKQVAVALQNLDMRMERAQLRQNTLYEIRDTCLLWRNMSKEILFDRLCSLLHGCYYFADVYIGMLGPQSKDITFILATEDSVMKDQKLLRGKPRGISFRAVDTISNLCVADTSSKLAGLLQHYGDPAAFSFPFLVVPLVAFLDSAMGVLNVDNCNEMSNGNERLEDLQIFFFTAASFISNAICGYKIVEAREEIRKIPQQADDFLHGIRLMKSALSKLVPLATRVAEVRFEPTDVGALTAGDMFGDQVVTIKEDFVIFVRLVSSRCLSPMVKSPFVSLSWQGSNLFSCFCGDNTDNAVARILVQKGLPVTRVNLMLDLKGLVNSVEHDIADKRIGLSYLANTPCLPVIHYLDSPDLDEVHVGEVQIMSKLFAQDLVICFNITAISCRDLSHCKNDDVPDPFCVIKWSRTEVGRTEQQRSTTHPSWESLRVDLRVVEEKFRKEDKIPKELIVEVWDSNVFGRSTFLGSINLDGNALLKYLGSPGTWIPLSPSTTLSYTQEQFVHGELMFLGSYVKAKDFDIGRIFHELRGDSQNVFTHSQTNQTQSLSTSYSRVEEPPHCIDCELGILSARGLAVGSSCNTSNSFCIVKLNNDELGRTAVVDNSVTPKWTDEIFEIQIPIGVDFGTFIVTIEVWTIDADGKGEFQGLIELTDKTLTSLLCGDKYRRRWFDLEKSLVMADSEQSLVQGELKLSGRPREVPITGSEEDAKDRELLEMHVLSATNLYANFPNKSDFSGTFCQVFWNDRLVHRTKPCLTESFVWRNEKLVVRLPNSKGLSQCSLVIEIRATSFGMNAGGDVKLGVVRLENEWLVRLLGNSGIYVMSVPVTDESPSDTDVSSDRNVPRELRLKGGPLGGAEVMVEDGRELFIDVLAASSLRSASKTTYVSAYCTLFWNRREIARTRCAAVATDPVWERERFTLRIPFIPGMSDEKMLSCCELLIEVWDGSNTAHPRFLGCVYLHGEELTSFITDDFSNTAWFPLAYHPNRHNNYDMLITGNLKFRGGYFGLPDNPNVSLQDYRMNILCAKGLAVADKFDITEPIVIVTWNGFEIYRTRSVGIALDPVWHNESVLLRVPNGVPLIEQNLIIEITEAKHHDFLGCVMLTGRELKEFLYTYEGKPIELPLKESPELSEDANELVQGSMSLEISEIAQIAATVPVFRYKEAILCIQSAEYLNGGNTFRKLDPFCLIIWKSALDNGGRDMEVGKTTVIKNTDSPDWEEERFNIDIPVDGDDDWSTLHLRIEIWDMEVYGKGTFLGCVPMDSDMMKVLLTREGGECLMPITFALQPHPNMKIVESRSIEGTLTVFGGSKAFFDMKDQEERDEIDVQITLRSLEIDESVEADDSTIFTLQSLSTLAVTSTFGSSVLLTIVRIRNLDRRPLSSYVVIIWNKLRVGQTKTVHRSNNPAFYEESFEVKLPLDDNPLDCHLNIEIYTTSIDQIDTLIGTVHITGKALQDLVRTTGSIENYMEFPVEHITRRKDCKIQITSSATRSRENSLLDDSVRAIPPALLSKVMNKKFRLSNLYSTDVENENEFTVHIQVFSISKLIKTDVLSSVSPYVSVLWDDKVIGKTPVIQSSTNPTWVDVSFHVDKPEGAYLKDFTLSFEVFNKKNFSTDAFLGSATCTGENLIAHCMSSTPIWMDLVGSEKFPGSHRFKGAQGRIEFGVKAKKAVVSQNTPVAPGSKEVELTILAATDLAKVDPFEKTDAYCVLSWRDSIIGKTAIVKRSVDPIWDEQTFTVRVPSTKNGFLSLFGEDSDEKHPLLIEVWHGSQVVIRKAVFLGCVDITQDSLMTLLYSDSLQRLWFPLVRSDHIPMKEQRHVQGKLEIMIGPKFDPTKSTGNIDIEFFIHSARNLRRTNTFGTTNPCCILRWNNRYVGKTTIQKNTSNPTWAYESFIVKLHVWKHIEDCSLYVEVWDWDVDERGQFFGSINVTGQTLKKMVYENTLMKTTFDLGRSEFLSERLQLNAIQGQITVRAGVVGAPPKAATQALLSIYAAENLTKSGAYCCVKLNGKELGRTAVNTKFSNPIWSGENFLISLPAHALVFYIEIDVWSRNPETDVDDFLGCVSLDEHALKSIILMHENSQSTSDAKFWLDLSKSIALKESSQKAVRGRLQLGVKPFHLEVNDAISAQSPSCFRLTWNDAREATAGPPCLEISILSASNLIDCDFEDGSLQYDGVACFVEWDAKECGSTEVSFDLVNPCWKQGKYTLRVPHTAESNLSILSLDVWGVSSVRRQPVAFLGSVTLSFLSLLRLFHSEVTLNLDQKRHTDTVQGSLTFHISFSFPYWDCTKPILSSKISRRISVLSAHEITKVNENEPYTKCFIMSEGVIKKGSIIVPSSCRPVWDDVYCDLILDSFNPQAVFVRIVHVDMEDKKEICIGEVEIPAELLLRPPENSWDAWLSPISKRLPPKYKFNVKGSVKLQVTLVQDDLTVLPWASKFQTPIASLTVRDASREWSDESNPDDELLFLEQRLWLGTAFDLSAVQEISSRPEWIIIPLQDFGIRVEGRIIGTRPGYRFAFALERKPSRAPMSDVTLLREVYYDLQLCLTELRLEEIYQSIRSHALDALKSFAQNTQVKNEILAQIVRIILTCIPGCSVYMAILSADAQVLHYKRFDINIAGTTDDDSTARIFHMHKSDEVDWVVCKSSKCITIKQLSDLGRKKLCCPKPFRNTRFPRIIVPMKTGDVSMGVLGIDCLDVYRRGSGRRWSGDSAIAKWLGDIAEIGGEVLYSSRESRALSRLTDYITRWYCSAEGLLSMLVSSCLDVLQGCRMFEIWASKEHDNYVESVMYKIPYVPTTSGRRMVINSISLTGNFLSGLRETRGNRCGLVCGVTYQSIEQCRAVTLDDIDEGGCIIIEQKIDLMVTKAERDVVITVYAVDESLNVLEEFSGAVRSVTFQEKTLQCFLQPGLGLSAVTVPIGEFGENHGATDLDAVVNVIWPVYDDLSRSVQGIKEFSVSITRVYGMKAADTISSTNDSFFIVKWGDEQLSRSSIKRATLEPVFNETFVLPYDSTVEKSCLIEFWHISLVGQTVFLGEVELTQEMLMLPPPGDIEILLQRKESLEKKKQRAVGGVLVLSYRVVLFEDQVVEIPVPLDDTVTTDGVSAAGDETVAVVAGLGTVGVGFGAVGVGIGVGGGKLLPREFLGYKTLALTLSIIQASDLSSSNTEIPPNPFAMVFLGTDIDPIFITEPSLKTLNPFWNLTHTFFLGIEPSEQLKLSDCPALRVELWDRTKAGGVGDFLGQAVIAASTYLNRSSGDFTLNSVLTKEQKNRNVRVTMPVKGTLALKFAVDDGSRLYNQKQFLLSLFNTLLPKWQVNIVFMYGRDLCRPDRAGTCHPKCVVLHNGIPIGNTSTRPHTASPKWQEEVVEFTASSYKFTLSDLVVEVQSDAVGSEGDLIGHCFIKPATYLHPVSTNITEFLEGNKETDRGKMPKPSITLRLSTQRSIQRITCSKLPSRVFDLPPNLMPENRQKILVVPDLGAEEDRLAIEKLNLPMLLNSVKRQIHEMECKPFDRTGFIGEIHFGQFIAACARKERTTMKSRAADVICLPVGILLNSDATDSELISMVARYPADKTSRRDIQFLDKVKSIAAHGLYQMGAKEQRHIERQTVISDILAIDRTLQNIEKVLSTKYLRQMEAAFQCSMKIYLFDTDGHTLCHVTKWNKALNPEQEIAIEIIQAGAKLCRHHLLLQIHQGTFSVADLTWDSIPQVCLPSLEDIHSQVSSVEDPRLVETIIRLAPKEASMGMCVVPLLGHMETLIGVLVVSGTDNVASSKFQTLKKADTWALDRPRVRRKSTISKDGQVVTITSTSEKEKIDIKRPEDGFIEGLIGLGKAIGTVVFDSKVYLLLTSLNDFYSSINESTSASNLLRYFFTAIAIAFPSLREISVWSANFSSRRLSIQATTNEAGMYVNTTANTKQSPSFLRSRTKNFNANRSTQSGLPKLGTSFQASFKSFDPIGDSNAPEGGAHSMNQNIDILAGYFGTEEIHRIEFGFATNQTDEFHIDEDNETSIGWKLRKLSSISTRHSTRAKQMSQENFHPTIQPPPLHRSTSQVMKEAGLPGLWLVTEPEVVRMQRLSKEELDTLTLTHGFAPRKVSNLAQTMKSFSSNFFRNNTDKSQEEKKDDDRATMEAQQSAKIDLAQQTMSLLHSEILQCMTTCELKQFHIISGHLLCSFAEDEAPNNLMDKLFDINNGMKSKAYIGLNTETKKPGGGRGKESNTSMQFAVTPSTSNRPLPPSSAPTKTTGSFLKGPPKAPLPPVPVPTTAQTVNDSISPAFIPKRKYFLSLASRGIGGDMGWDVLGNATEKVMSEVTKILDLCLLKIAEERKKVEIPQFSNTRSGHFDGGISPVQEEGFDGTLENFDKNAAAQSNGSVPTPSKINRMSLKR